MTPAIVMTIVSIPILVVAVAGFVPLIVRLEVIARFIPLIAIPLFAIPLFARPAVSAGFNDLTDFSYSRANARLCFQISQRTRGTWIKLSFKSRSACVGLNSPLGGGGVVLKNVSRDTLNVSRDTRLFFI